MNFSTPYFFLFIQHTFLSSNVLPKLSLNESSKSKMAEFWVLQPSIFQSRAGQTGSMHWQAGNPGQQSALSTVPHIQYLPFRMWATEEQEPHLPLSQISQVCLLPRMRFMFSDWAGEFYDNMTQDSYWAFIYHMNFVGAQFSPILSAQPLIIL